MTRPLSQTVKTSPSHGEDMGSIPVGVTNCKYPDGRCQKVLAFYMQEAMAVHMQRKLSIGTAPRSGVSCFHQKKCGSAEYCGDRFFLFIHDGGDNAIISQSRGDVNRWRLWEKKMGKAERKTKKRLTIPPKVCII